MAKSYPKQSTQKGVRGDVALGRNAVLLFSLLLSLVALMVSIQSRIAAQVGHSLLNSVRGFDLTASASAAESEAPAEAAVPTAGAPAPEDRRIRALAGFLAKRYRVSNQAMLELVDMAYSAGGITRMDPLLILAVMAVESRFNPIAESVMGAKGLMQIIPKHHADKLKSTDGEVDVLDPEINILAGARILREYIGKSGDLAAGLRRYGGGASDEDNLYANKVISERERLQQVLRTALNRPVRAAPKASPGMASL
jgi:soluble lytic murein transglycosylase-like protein